MQPRRFDDLANKAFTGPLSEQLRERILARTRFLVGLGELHLKEGSLIRARRRHVGQRGTSRLKSRRCRGQILRLSTTVREPDFSTDSGRQRRTLTVYRTNGGKKYILQGKHGIKSRTVQKLFFKDVRENYSFLKMSLGRYTGLNRIKTNWVTPTGIFLFCRTRKTLRKQPCRTKPRRGWRTFESCFFPQTRCLLSLLYQLLNLLNHL